jgi:hypothetical protein
MSFLSSLFGGQNSTLNANIAKTGAIGDFSTGMGEKNLTTASDFWNSILSGDSSKQMAVLNPAISSVKTSTAQENKSTAEMGTRSGGNAASTAATNDKVHDYITKLIGDLTGKAAGEVGSIGSNQLNVGLEALGMQTDMSQKRMENWEKSILGKGITTAVQSAENADQSALGL